MGPDYQIEVIDIPHFLKKFFDFTKPRRALDIINDITELKKQGIKILMLNHANWKTLCYISEERHKLDNQHSLSIENSKKYTFYELQKILERSNIAKHHIKFHKQTKKSKSSLVKAAFELLFLSKNNNLKTHYTYYGRTKLRVLSK